MKAREGPSAQDGAERIITPTGQLFEEVSLERFLPIIQLPVGLPTALDEI